MKRTGGLAIACVLIALTLPLMAAVALIVKLDCGGPVLTRENRRTCAGRNIRVLKFRTTRTRQLEVRGWPRPEQTTAVGRFLRYTRIVDLPQLCNVVRGEMSLVDVGGERPGFFD